MDVVSIKKQISDLIRKATAEELEMNHITFTNLTEWISGEQAEKDKINDQIESWANPKSQKASNTGLQIAADQMDAKKQLK